MPGGEFNLKEFLEAVNGSSLETYPPEKFSRVCKKLRRHTNEARYLIENSSSSDAGKYKKVYQAFGVPLKKIRQEEIRRDYSQGLTGIEKTLIGIGLVGVIVVVGGLIYYFSQISDKAPNAGQERLKKYELIDVVK